MKRILIATCLVISALVFVIVGSSWKSEQTSGYMVISQPTPYKLVQAVDRKVREGWKPTGGVVIAGKDDYWQAIYK